MRFNVTRQACRRWCAALGGAAIALVIGGVLDAQQAQGAAPQQPAAAGQPPAQGQPAARGNQADTGPVRDANNAIIGFTKLAEIPGTPWRIHDAARPHPRVITPGATPGAAPSDAIALFDGKDLSKWAHSKQGQLTDATWPVRDLRAGKVPRFTINVIGPLPISGSPMQTKSSPERR